MGFLYIFVMCIVACFGFSLGASYISDLPITHIHNCLWWWCIVGAVITGVLAFGAAGAGLDS